MIVKATPIGPQTANAAAEPVRHLGELPTFLEAPAVKAAFLPGGCVNTSMGRLRAATQS